MLGDASFLLASALARTVRIRGVDTEALAESLGGKPGLIVGWHGQAAAVLGACRRVFGPDQPLAVAALDNLGGLAMARLARRQGVEVVIVGPRLSDRLQAMAAFEGLLHRGCLGMLTADGPSGPAQALKDAVVLVAKGAGAAVLPCAAACSRPFTMRWRWDRAVVPLPGSTAVFLAGQAVEIAPDGDTATQTAEVQAALDSVNREARLLARGRA